MPTHAKPLRRDAQRNRDLLVAAARELFATRGLDVALDEIARTAGVSSGTLYNHFPDRNDLVDAVFADRAATVVRIAEHALSMPDPWDGLVHFLERVCEMQVPQVAADGFDLPPRRVDDRVRQRRSGPRDHGADRGRSTRPSIKSRCAPVNSPFSDTRTDALCLHPMITSSNGQIVQSTVQGGGQQQVDHDPSREFAYPLLGSAAFDQDDIDHLKRHDLR